jgi:hypothetical protein
MTPASSTPSPSSNAPSPMTDFTVPASDLTVPSSDLTVDDTLTNYLASTAPTTAANLPVTDPFSQVSFAPAPTAVIPATIPAGNPNNPSVAPGTPVGWSTGLFDANGNPVLNSESGDQQGAFLPTVLNISDEPISAHDAAIIAMENAAIAQRTKEQNVANTEVQGLTKDAINRTEEPTGLETLVPAADTSTTTVDTEQTSSLDTGGGGEQVAGNDFIDSGPSGWDSGEQPIQYADNNWDSGMGGWGQDSSYDSYYRGKSGGFVSNFKKAENLDFYKSGLTHHADGGLMALAKGGAAQPFFRKGKFNFHPAQMYADGGMPVAMAMGGLGTLGGYSDGGRLLKGPGDGVSDSIPATIGRNAQPARLADGEFVIPARIVSELGNGSTDAGARKLYAMMDRIQRTRSKTVGKDRVAVNSRADKNLPA